MVKNSTKLKVKDNIKKLYRTPIPQYSRMDYLRLDKNENPASYSRKTVKEMLKTITPQTISAYPEPHTLYDKLARWLGVSVNNIIVCNGSDGAIKSIFEVFVDKGDEVVILDPTYAMYEVYIKMFGAKKVNIRFDANFEISEDKLLSSINSKTALVVIANPNSPTGTVLKKGFLEEVVRKCLKKKAVLLVDEAYYHFYPETMLPLTKKFNNVVITRTFSKAIGMASARLGFAVADKAIIKEMFKVRPMYEVSGFAVKLGEFIIANDYLISRYTEEEREGKEYLTKELKKMGFSVLPGYANFVLAKAGSEGGKIYKFLRSENILITANFSNYLLKNFIRFTTGPKKTMKILVNKLKEYRRSAL